VNDSAFDGNQLTVQLVSSVASSAGTLTLASGGLGGFTYVPSTSFVGTATFTYQAKDPSGELSNMVTVTITVTAPVPPVATNDNYNVNKGGTLTIAAPGVMGDDTQANHDALTAVLVKAPTQGTFTLNASGAFTYAPKAGYSGSDSFTYQAKDTVTGLLSNIATVTLTVLAHFDGDGCDHDRGARGHYAGDGCDHDKAIHGGHWNGDGCAHAQGARGHYTGDGCAHDACENSSHHDGDGCDHDRHANGHYDGDGCAHDKGPRQGRG
jgi:hypothetical protein